MGHSSLSRALCFVVLLLLGASPAAAQYFGRNKVQYDDFNFKTLRTDHFEIYFYPEEEQAVQDAARMAERWYQRHSGTFLRSFDRRKPLIFYANDADFQQTNVISGMIGQGTGGVTESLKERVIMPMTGSYAETNHVLGHELVHSFQYDIALRGDVQGFQIQRLPLWLVEGMAEYLSVGRDDPHTAMWLRDAALRDDLPTVEQMTKEMYKYFPYRYGQAYMAYIGGKYGDAAVTNLYKLAGRVGVDSAFVYALGVTTDSLSSEWKAAVRDAYLPIAKTRTPADSVGTTVVGTPGADNQIHVSPVVSPDGRYVAYIGRDDLFTTNLLVADAQTGRVIQTLDGAKRNPHFDALRFIGSAGTWSPDGRSFAFVTFVEGDNEINLLDVESGNIRQRISVKGVGAIQSLAWSPDGQKLAFTGLDGGISNLYVLDLNTRAVRQLTNDRYADLQPAWAPDGETIAFTTDRGENGSNFSTLNFGPMRIGLIDLSSRDIRTVRPFTVGMQHNPQFAPDGQSIYFLANPDGFKDIYRHDLSTNQTYRVTHIQTGISGITEMSPALSVAAQSGRVMFSVFSNSSYTIATLTPENAQGTLVAPTEKTAAAAPADTSNLQAMRLLPPAGGDDNSLVTAYLSDPLTGLPEQTSYEVSGYDNTLRLDGVAPPSIGGTTGGVYGPQFVGGVAFSFSDMLGNQTLDVFLQANGTFKDIGGGGFYTNQGDRLNYGVGAFHIPYRYGNFQYVDQNGDGLADAVATIFQRTFRSSVLTTASYPLSQTRRFELSAGMERFGFDVEVQLFDGFQTYEVNPGDVGLGNLPDPIYLGRVGAAFVGDFSNAGFVSPLQGGRYRFQVTPFFGSRSYVSTLADYRRYFFWEPVTFAVRGLHVGNYGVSESNLQDSFEDVFVRETLGDPYQLAFVRGYSFSSIFQDPRCFQGGQCATDLLIGSRIGLASAEIRVPFFGTDALGLFNFPYLPTELVAFTDVGVAWTSENLEDFTFTRTRFDPQTGALVDRPAQPVVSTGISARFNVLGAVILETFYARTFQRAKDWDFGLILRPGW
ncbi:basic secretory protein-like protein [Salisaeta longa]|uniref:basic secretory protein-like protein n=1 Tax=Salisaeta longa TaxID=503170 RepID=UPI00041B10A8|nr:basic secretory protein-like protein [Salisaeta longa]